jgi:acetyl esterase
MRRKTVASSSTFTGGLVAGDLDTHDNISRVLSNSCQAIVVALDYRKPPEAPYPAGLNDCQAVLNWTIQQATALGGSNKHIVLLGDRGGGLFAASLQVQLQRSFVPSAMVLVNPAVDLRQSDNPLYQLVTKWYLNERSPNDSIISPVLAKNISFFLPTLLITSEKDELRSQGLEWRTKLAAAKIKTTWVDLHQQDHLGGLWAMAHPEARKAINATIAFVNALPKPK